ncbi:hypothetical protein MPSEU_000095200 [Mayamaea pseudoterrestris]|nr:hypothetical protein MPSEU_000095200 [Mayamaea pseudoterrestris]
MRANQSGLAQSSKKRHGDINGLDQTLSLYILALVLIYTVVTVLTYTKISSSDAAGAMAAESSSSSGTTVQAVDQQSQQKMLLDPITTLQHTFPIHGTDMEEIPHPGLSIATEKSNIPKDLPRTMMVPKFFDDSHGHAYGGSIRNYLNNGEQLMNPEQAAKIGSIDANGRETIFCSVASYRDPECNPTVEDLYARAKYPERIRVAILDQRIDGDNHCRIPAQPCDTHPDQAFCKYRHLIDVYEMDARLAVGPVFARHLGHRHYRGEFFAMQLDSHVRFIQGWDVDIVDQWKSAKNEMAVLTTYLSDITDSIDQITHTSKHPARPIMCQSDYEGQGAYKHLRHGQQPEGTPGIRGQPTLHPFWAAGFSFARGHFVIQVPYDQYQPMVFQGEEISIGLRAFTYGYDFYAPERGVCFHMYAINDNKEKRKSVPLFWENGKTYAGVGMRAMKRLNNIIGMAKDKDEDWQHEDIEKYGLGKVRDPAKFFSTFGIHTESQTVEAHLCRFVGKPMMEVFLPALRTNRMGIDYDKIDYVFVDPEKKDKIKQ